MVYKRFLSLVFFALYPSIHSSTQSYEEHSGRAGCESNQKNIKEVKVLSSELNKNIEEKNISKITEQNPKESYYAAPKKKKQEREPRKLKEQIGGELADFIKNMHKNIEINAQICQIASEVLQELVEQDKNNKILNANSKELQECLKELEKNNCEQRDYLEKLDKTKKFLKSGCIN